MNEIGGKLEGSRANSCHGQDSLGCRIFECAAMGSGGKRRALVLIAGYHTSETQGTAISIHNAGLSVGLIAGSSLSEFLSDHFGWRIGFYVLGGADLLLALAAQLFLLDHPEALPRVPPARSPLWTGVLDLVRIHSFLVIYGARSRRAILSVRIRIGWSGRTLRGVYSKLWNYLIRARNRPRPIFLC